MCGIFCSVSKREHISPSDNILQRLQARGPDSNGRVLATCPNTSAVEDETYVTLFSTVLSLRGLQTTTQPYRGDNEPFKLCWNGEAWSVDCLSPAGNDTEAIHRLLSEALTSSSNFTTPDTCAESASKIANALSRVAGPYAFVFFDRSLGKLFFGRDFLGRRSLLIKTSSSGDLTISSVSDDASPDGWIEVECDGIHYIDLKIANENGVCHSDTSSWNGFARFVIGVVPYNFASQLNAEIADDVSVLPALHLNRDLSPSQEVLHTNSRAVARLEALLHESLSARVRDIPMPPTFELENPRDQHRAKLAVLFSGGLDCTVLARLSHGLLPLAEPIDLLNVAFENPRIHKHNVKGDAVTAYELCPDRITGKNSFAELQRICPKRQWRFVAIDVPYSETQQHRDTVISLMHPHNTEMDLSIANALYFAARGTGGISHSLSGKLMPYTTPARVLLSGLGADELFAGYTRHATAFKRAGLDGLLDELELDVSRLGKRNLGRDDRVMSHWGKEVRFPYLDESLLSWALNAPSRDKCGFGEFDLAKEASLDGDDGSTLAPEKKVLRCLAWRLGMRGVAREKKRAVRWICMPTIIEYNRVQLMLIIDPVRRAHREDEFWQHERNTRALMSRSREVPL